jgi:hypothetical protein
MAQIRGIRCPLLIAEEEKGEERRFIDKRGRRLLLARARDNRRLLLARAKAGKRGE